MGNFGAHHVEEHAELKREVQEGQSESQLLVRLGQEFNYEEDKCPVAVFSVWAGVGNVEDHDFDLGSTVNFIQTV